jgi:hypothetical protein
LTATIAGIGEPAKVIVRNLSAHGALIEGAALSEETSGLTFGSNGISTSGAIVWARGGRSGVRFDEEVNYRDGFRCISAPDRRSRPRPMRPGLKSKPLSQGERLLMERWATSGLTALGH